jgi:hypothetical protein
MDNYRTSPSRGDFSQEYIDMDNFEGVLMETLEDNKFYSVDVDLSFKGERINSDGALHRRLGSLFTEIKFTDAKVIRRGSHIKYRVVLDKENFINFSQSESMGIFEGDYSARILGFYANDDDEEVAYIEPDTPIKKTRTYTDALRKGEKNDLTITIRRGRHETDMVARGWNTYNILSEPKEVVKILDHYNLTPYITSVTKPTPAIPTLEIKLLKTIRAIRTEKGINEEPLLIYDPTPQMKAAGSSELWAHARLDNTTPPKRVKIEGIVGRIEKEDLQHELNYFGEVMTTTLLTWGGDGPLKDIPNGDVAVYMKLETEINFLIFGATAYKVSYPMQAVQCSYCFSWQHRAGGCDRLSENRRDLLMDYKRKWRRQVGYKMRGQEQSEDGEDEATDEVKVTDINEDTEGTVVKDKDHGALKNLNKETPPKNLNKETPPPETQGSERRILQPKGDKDNDDPSDLLKEFAGKYTEEDASKKRKGEKSSPKLSPQSKKSNTNMDNVPTLREELEKIRHDANKDDLTGVKKKALSNGLKTLIDSYKDGVLNTKHGQTDGTWSEENKIINDIRGLLEQKGQK